MLGATRPRGPCVDGHELRPDPHRLRRLGPTRTRAAPACLAARRRRVARRGTRRNRARAARGHRRGRPRRSLHALCGLRTAAGRAHRGRRRGHPRRLRPGHVRAAAHAPAGPRAPLGGQRRRLLRPLSGPRDPGADPGDVGPGARDPLRHRLRPPRRGHQADAGRGCHRGRPAARLDPGARDDPSRLAVAAAAPALVRRRHRVVRRAARTCAGR